MHLFSRFSAAAAFGARRMKRFSRLVIPGNTMTSARGQTGDGRSAKRAKVGTGTTTPSKSEHHGRSAASKREARLQKQVNDLLKQVESLSQVLTPRRAQPPSRARHTLSHTHIHFAAASTAIGEGPGGPGVRARGRRRNAGPRRGAQRARRRRECRAARRDRHPPPPRARTGTARFRQDRGRN